MNAKTPMPGTTGKGASQLTQSTTIDEAQDTTNSTKFNIVERSDKPRFLGDLVAPIVARIARRHRVSEPYARAVYDLFHTDGDAA